MADREDSRLKRVAIDVTPLLTGGANGGAALVALSSLPHFAALAPEVDFTLLTHPRSHDELAEFEGPNMHRRMVGAAERAQVEVPTQAPLAEFKSRLRRRVGRLLPSRVRGKLRRLSKPPLARAPVSSLVKELQADLLFCPFTAPYYFDPRVPLVSLVHDLQYVYYPQFFSSQDYDGRAKNFASACQLADRLICGSEFVRSTVLENSTLSPERVITVHHGLLRKPVPQQPDKVAEVLRRLGLVSDRYLLFPSNFWRHKNHRMLLTALGLYRSWHPDSDLQLACTGTPDDQMEQLRTAADTMGLGATVVFPGFVSSDDLAALYQACRGLIFPSLYEGFGMPIVEAMAAGKPVLCSNVTSLPEIAGDGALLFDPRKPHEIARSIEALESNDELRLSLVQRGRDRARIFGNAACLAGTYLRIFRDLVDGTTRHHTDALLGLYGDGWVGESLMVSYQSDPSPRSLELVLSVPEWLPSENLTVTMHDSAAAQLESHLIPRGERLLLRRKLPASGGLIDLRLQPVCVPSNLNIAPDTRELSCVCEVARLTSERETLDLKEVSSGRFVNA